MKQLIRDTIVVLIALFLLTLFLLVVDQSWGFAFRALGVLPKPLDSATPAGAVQDKSY